MSIVVAMLHAGSRCAFPVQQVLLAELARQTDELRGCLWGNRRERGDAPPDLRILHVLTGTGAEPIACSSPRLVELDRERVWPLPDLLAEMLDLPHIVGIADIEGTLHWVVDARRLSTDVARS